MGRGDDLGGPKSNPCTGGDGGYDRGPRRPNRHTPPSAWRPPSPPLAAPVAPPGPRAKVAVLAIVLPLAILYPLTGLSLIVAVGLDRIVSMLSRTPPQAA